MDLSSTYRIQFDPAQMDFERAASLLDHFDALGISHVYASPLTTPRPGSTHGYDVVDPTCVNPELGGRTGLDRLVEQLHTRSMGLILDIVPNHMAIGRHNRWWMDALAHGPQSPYWSFFDIRAGEDPMILPILGRPYSEALVDGELQLVLEEGKPTIAYWDERFPLSPGSIERLSSGRTRLTVRITEINRDPDALHGILDAQHYRLAWWQLSRERLDHRRFFTITELIGMRQENPAVFDETHRLVVELAESGAIDGLRIDHIDGLRDPDGYLDRLTEATGLEQIHVEKILAPHERIPQSWSAAGTTGYEYIDVAAKAFIDPAGHAQLRSHYDGFAASPTDFERLVFDQQRFIIHERLGAETHRFTDQLAGLARNDRVARDALTTDLIELAIDVVASLPVYRTYAAHGHMSEDDQARVQEAVDLAIARGGERPDRVVRFVTDLLSLRHPATAGPQERADRERFVEQLQQFTGAVMAKGVEDTAFYQYNVLLSLNEVGGHPSSIPADPVGSYHDHNLEIAARHPSTLTASTTHDTKRAEDVRHRISALTQFADEWVSKVEGWHVRNRVHRVAGAAGSAPTNNEELFIYQTLLGSWPLSPDPDYEDRILGHLVKAAREAKVHTEWLEPDDEHETALRSFASGLLSDEVFVGELESFGSRVWRAGALDALAQTALRLTAPGVPDIYRGTELWDLSLTDPDNRRPVDWERIGAALKAALDDTNTVMELAERWQDGTIKTAVLTGGLRLRKAWPEVFIEGRYIPLSVDGSREENVVAAAREHDGRWVVTIVPRLTATFGDRNELWTTSGWDDTTILLPDEAPGAWFEILTRQNIESNGRIHLAPLFAQTPVGMLKSDTEEH